MQFQVKLPVQIGKQGKRYVAFTPALDISTSGKTEAEAKRRFSNLVELFFDELEMAGTIDEVLRELGWKKSVSRGAQDPAWTPPAYKSEQVAVRIPVAA